MSRIFKTVNFVSDHSVTLEATGLGISPLAKSGQAEAGEAVPPSPAGPDKPADLDPASAGLLQEAQKHVEMMLNQARTQVSTWQEEAQQAGWETGYAEARQLLEAELAETLASAQRLAEAAVAAYEQFWRDNQAQLGQLAVAIAEKIIGKELALNPKAITDIVASAIQVANIRGACRIRVNPKDYEVIEPFWNAVPSLQPAGQTWELTPDPHLKPGGCLFEVGGGTIDAQLDTQLKQAALALQN